MDRVRLATFKLRMHRQVEDLKIIVEMANEGITEVERLLKEMEPRETVQLHSTGEVRKAPSSPQKEEIIHTHSGRILFDFPEVNADEVLNQFGFDEYLLDKVAKEGKRGAYKTIIKVARALESLINKYGNIGFYTREVAKILQKDSGVELNMTTISGILHRLEVNGLIKAIRTGKSNLYFAERIPKIEEAQGTEITENTESLGTILCRDFSKFPIKAEIKSKVYLNPILKVHLTNGKRLETIQNMERVITAFENLVNMYGNIGFYGQEIHREAQVLGLEIRQNSIFKYLQDLGTSKIVRAEQVGTRKKYFFNFSCLVEHQIDKQKDENNRIPDYNDIIVGGN